MIHRSNAWALALMLFVCSALRAQEYSFRYFGVADGLNNLSVRSVFQDRVGFLWVATVNGYFRHGGERFEAFKAAQGVPNGLAIEKHVERPGSNAIVYFIEPDSLGHMWA